MNSDSKPTIFRQESLERLSSPEQLDQLMQIVNLKSWIPLASVGTLLLLGVLWSIFGRIPITATGKGILLRSSDTSNQLVGVAYFNSADSVRIQPGMSILLIPDVAGFASSGGIMGRVKTVSGSAITTLEAARQAEATASLDKQEIEVLAELEPDPSTASGYKWSSGGADPKRNMQLPPGLPTIAHITLAEKAPIAFVFPFLEQ